ncbi:MAG: GFA family protein [Oceanospirillaceae bacterium]|nr:GFA family protein [Oceanospirillaceae bacterium]
MIEKHIQAGGCLCGAIRYQISGPMRDVIACHCQQCQKSSGHHVAATRVAMTDFKLNQSTRLKWFHSSRSAKRGFCENCGSNLFWTKEDGSISIFAGTLDQPCGLRLSKHIFVEDKADYYDLTDNLPKFQKNG